MHLHAFKCQPKIILGRTSSADGFFLRATRFARWPAHSGASCSGQKGGGNYTLACAQPPCGKSPTKDKRTCKRLRIVISTLKSKCITKTNILQTKILGLGFPGESPAFWLQSVVDPPFMKSIATLSKRRQDHSRDVVGNEKTWLCYI